MNFLQLAYIQGVKIASAEAGISFEDVMKMAATLPPPVPTVARLKSLTLGATKAAPQSLAQITGAKPVAGAVIPKLVQAAR